jgi:hypothetical protein
VRWPRGGDAFQTEVEEAARVAGSGTRYRRLDFFETFVPIPAGPLH